VRAGDRSVPDGDDESAAVRVDFVRAPLCSAQRTLPFRPIWVNHDSIGSDSESAI
jgi:hypothetical protein